MPKNKGRGKNRRRGTNDAEDEKRELEFKKEGQEYGQVLRMLGNGRCEVLCSDKTTRLSHICGKLHKKVWISAGDIVLVCVRDYQDTKADIVHRYYHHEARSLKAYAVDMSAVGPEEQILNQPDNIPDDVDTKNQDEETAAMIEEPASGDEGANDIDSNWSMECYTLFSNGMRESEQRHDVLMAADKFEVASCMRYCSRSLRNLPMTSRICTSLSGSSVHVIVAEAVQPLTDAAKQFLAVRYKDITNADVFHTVSTCLLLELKLFWQAMISRKLRKVMACNDFEHEFAQKVVVEALFFKAEAPHRQRTLQCVVYLDLKREECANLFPSGRVYSQAFHLGGQGFFLSAHCNMDQQSSFHCFGLFLGMQEKGSVTFAVDYEFAARSKPTEEYISKYKGNYTFTGGKAVGYRNLFATPWTSFMAEDSLYFINGILHLQAELTIKL
ncbi:TRAF-like, SKP1/BTB/POZ domain, BTB/Kelch-associated protein [Tanacetum coccineum]